MSVAQTKHAEAETSRRLWSRPFAHLRCPEAAHGQRAGVAANKILVAKCEALGAAKEDAVKSKEHAVKSSAVTRRSTSGAREGEHSSRSKEAIYASNEPA